MQVLQESSEMMFIFTISGRILSVGSLQRSVSMLGTVGKRVQQHRGMQWYGGMQ